MVSVLAPPEVPEGADQTHDLTSESAPGAVESSSTALVPAAATAARERARLERSAGKPRVLGFVARVGLGARYLGTAEAAARGLRYQPVAWAVIAIVALAFYLPGRVNWSPAPQAVAAPNPVTVAPTPTPPPPVKDTPIEATPSPVPPPPPSIAPGPTAPAPPPTTASPPPLTEPPIGRPDDGTAPTTVPLTVRGFGWASQLPPTPLPTDEVAEGTAPVAMRLGRVDRVSFLRLDGADDSLELTEHDESAREALGDGTVAICPILDADWAEEPGQSFDDAPEWDQKSCVAGAENDGRWTFDLSSFAASAASGDDQFEPIVAKTGFALVPTSDAPPDFNIAFQMPDGLTQS